MTRLQLFAAGRARAEIRKSRLTRVVIRWLEKGRRLAGTRRSMPLAGLLQSPLARVPSGAFPPPVLDLCVEWEIRRWNSPLPSIGSDQRDFGTNVSSVDALEQKSA
jgi:hypothetical protein